MAITVAEVQVGSQPSANSRALTFDNTPTAWTPALNDLVPFFGGADSAITTLTVPAGWVNLHGGTTYVDGPASSHAGALQYHWVTSGEVSAVTKLYTIANMFSPARAGVSAALVLRGVDTTTPVDTFNTTTGNATTHAIAGLPTVGVGKTVISWVYPDDAVSYTAPAGWTIILSQSTGSAGRSVVVLKRDALSDGSAIAATNISTSVGTGAEYLSITVAFNPIPPPSGSASGSYTWAAGTVSGTRTPKATGAGTYTWAGAATGSAPIVGQNDGVAAGNYTWAATCTGKRTPKGSKTGNYTWAATLLGGQPKRGTAAGSYGWSSSARGLVPYRAEILVAETAAANINSSARAAVFDTEWNPHVRDIVVLVGTASTVATMPSTPTGWTNPLGGTTVLSSDSHTLAVLWRSVTVTEQNTPTRTYTATGMFNASVTGDSVGFVLRGVDPANVVDAIASAIGSGDTTTPHSLPALAGAGLSNDSAIIALVAKDGTGTYTTPADHEQLVTSNTYTGLWAGRRDALAYTGTDVDAVNITPSAGDEYIALTIAFGALPLALGKKYDAGLYEAFQLADEPTNTVSLAGVLASAMNNSAVDARPIINTAIDTASPGDNLVMPDADYYFKGSVSGLLFKADTAGVTLSGTTKEGTVIHTQLSGSPHSVVYFTAGCTNSRVQNLTIAYSSGSIPDMGMRFSDANLAATTYTVNRVNIRNVDISGFSRVGVGGNNTKHILVEDSHIHDATAWDGGGEGYGVLWDGPCATDNWTRNNLIDGDFRHGLLQVDLAHHNLFGGTMDGLPGRLLPDDAPAANECGNELDGARSGAVDMHGEIEYSCEISYNLIHDNTRDGTTISPNGAGIEVGEPPTDETLGGSGHGRSGTQHWIHHNEIFGCPEGIRVMNKSHYVYIEYNWSHDNDDGILFNQTTGYANTGVIRPWILHNLVEGNIYGIRLLNSVTAAWLFDNTVRFNTTYGLYGDVNTQQYVIEGNDIHDNGDGPEDDVVLLSPLGFYDGAEIGESAGDYTWGSSTAGKRTPKASGSGTYTWAFAATGERTPKGSKTGNYTWSSATTGKRVPKASVSANYTWAATATGKRTPKGSKTGTYAWSSIAVGSSPNVGFKTGFALGNYTWSSAGTSATNPFGAVSAAYGWAATVTGRHQSRSALAGAYGWAATAVGATTPMALRSGVGAGGYNWGSTVVGEFDPLSELVGVFGWTSVAAGGDLIATNLRLYEVTQEDRTLPIDAEDRTIFISAVNTNSPVDVESDGRTFRIPAQVGIT